VTEQSLANVNALQSAITRPYFETVDLLDQVETLKNGIADRLFRQEYPYLWSMSEERDTATTRKLAAVSLASEKGILDYYLGQNWGYYVYALLIGLAFFIWVARNLRTVRRQKGGPEALGQLGLQHVRDPPVLTSLVVVLNILPFFNFSAPPLVTQFGQLLLLILVSLLFSRQWPRRPFLFWMLMILLYLLFISTGAALVPKWGARLWLVVLNAASMVLGYYWMQRILPLLPYPWMVRIASWVYLVLNAISIAANALGRVAIARLCSITAIFGLVQIVLLSVFIESVMEGFQLQLLTSRQQNKGAARMSLLGRLQKGVFKALIVIAAATWLVAFSINLNIYDAVYAAFSRVMNHAVKLGSVVFRIGNVLLFIFILYLSNLLQKYIGFLYSSGDEQTAHTGRKGSRLVMIRLVLIIVGFLFAIVASGLPVDRITIVLGALGVGIGLGLQNIVNNLVSGIILIFERPFQIGDYIELNGKKGIVRDIGIRASKLVTEDATEIIMPNGDLLSGEVINWTVRNSQVRIEVPLTVEGGHSYEELKGIIEDALKDHPDLSRSDGPRVLLNTSTEKTVSLTVLVWVANIGQIQTIKSEVLRLLVQRLREHQIRTV
jgi:small-conductance mechanosensitive channel